MAEYVNKAELYDRVCDERCELCETQICEYLYGMPTIDIVHCNECKQWEYPVKIRELTGKIDHIGRCNLTGWLCGKEGYCMYGERKSDD